MRNRMVLLLAVCVAVTLGGCELSFAGDITPPPNPSPQATQPPAVVSAVYPYVAPDLAAGQAIYMENCAPCHGESGGGDGPSAASLPNPPLALSDARVARAAVPANWFTIVSQGNLERFMPGFSGSLSDRDIWDVVAYSFSLSAPAASLQDAGDDYLAYCAECHAADGSGRGTQAASLPVALPDWRDASQLTNRSSESLFTAVSQGKGQHMPAFSDQLSDDQLWALASYIRAFSLGAPPSLAAAAIDRAATPVPGTFNLAGRLENASGGALPAGMTVRLQVLDAMQVSQSLETQAGADGSYAFSNIELADARIYLVSTEFQQLTFHANPLQASDIRPGDEARLPVRVFETSNDASALVADRLHVFLEKTGETGLQVVELYLISNIGNSVVMPAGEGQTIVDFTLPPGAFNLQFEDGVLGERFLETADGFGDTSKVFPGEQQLQVLFAYQIPFDREASLEIRTPIFTRSVIFAVPADMVKLRSPQLAFTGGRAIQGDNVNVYEANTLDAGTAIQVQLSSPWKNPIAALFQNRVATGLLGAGIFLLVAGIAGYVVTRQSGFPKRAAKDEPVSQEALLDEVLALDDLYQAGNLPVDAYQQRRGELMDRLRQLNRP